MTVTICNRTHSVRTATFLTEKPVENMRCVATMPARLTDDDSIFDRIYSRERHVYTTKDKVVLATPLNATCVLRSSTLRFASSVMLSVIRQTEQRGSARLQLGQAVG